MPVVTCPKCPTKLRVNDAATGNVKCPKCATVFPIVAPKPSAAFEVVDDEPPASPPPPAPKSAARPKASSTPAPMPLPPPPPPPPVKEEFAFDLDDKPKKKKPVDDDDDDEEEDRPRSKRRRDDDDDDDDDRPRKKRRRDEDDDDDDDDDRPRSTRRRGADDADDDEDDRPRGKRRRGADDEDVRSRKKRRHYDDEDDDDDEDEWHRNPKKKGNAAFGAAKTGVLLLNISFWLYLVSVGLIAFFIFLGWVGAFDRSSPSTTTTTVRRSGPPPRGFNQQNDFESSSSNDTGELLVKLPGILGIGNWIVAGIGFGFCIAGPKRARGMAITAASLAGAHLVLAGISISNVGSMMGGQLGGGASAGSWILWATTLPILDTFLPLLIMGAGKIIGSDYIFMLLGAGCELARMIFAMLLVKALATSAKDYDSEEKAQLGMMGACIIVGATVLLGLLLALLAKAEAFSGGKGTANIMIGSILLVYLGFTAMNIMPILATNTVRRSLARKARGK